MYATWALTFAGLLATAASAGDHHATNAPRPAATAGPLFDPNPPRFSDIANWGQPSKRSQSGEGCDYKIQALLADPKTALMRAELKTNTQDMVQQVVRDIMAQYMQEHQKVSRCMSYHHEPVTRAADHNNGEKRDHQDDFQQATEDLVRALRVIQDPETQKLMRHKVKEAVKKVEGKRQ